MNRLADLRITPVRRRRKGDIFCASCGQFHERELHPPVSDVLDLNRKPGVLVTGRASDEPWVITDVA